MSSEALDPNQVSFPGQVFQKAREELGLSIDQVCKELNLTPKVIRLIESGQPETFHNPVFMRGYIRNYSKRLGLSAEKYVELFAHMPGIHLAPSQIRSTTSIPNAELGRSPWIKLITWVFVLTLVATVIWWSRQQYGITTTDTLPVNPLTPQEISRSAEVFDEDVLESGESDTPAEVLSDPDNGEELSDHDEASVANEEPAVEALTPETLDRISEADVAEEVSSFAGLEMRFTDECWVQIRDASGQTLYSQVARPGAVVQLEGVEPLSLVIGRVEAVSFMAYAGQKVDLKALASGNVARFTLPRP